MTTNSRMPGCDTVRGPEVDDPIWRNWSGHLECRPSALLRPSTIDDVSRAVTRANSVRLAGSGHSFTELVPTEATLLSLENLSGVISADQATRRARVFAGTTIRDLGPPLAEAGLSLANQGDIDCQALAGAVATATHGTGHELGCIASRISGFSLVDARGDVVEAAACGRSELLAAGCVSLGALGVFVELEVDAEPRYHLRERVWAERTEDLLARWETLRDSHRHFELFAFPFTGMALAKTLDHEPWQPSTSRDAPAADAAADGSSHTFARLLEQNVTDPVGARERFASGLGRTRPSEDTGPAHEIFPSERLDRFNEMEYAIPLETGADCLREVLAAIESADLPVLFPIEFRTVAADRLWLSPFYERDSAVLAVHQYHKQDFRPVFAVAEPIFRRYGGRAHWGKIHTTTRDQLTTLYPRFDDFCALRQEMDPEGKFLNPYLRRLFSGT